MNRNNLKLFNYHRFLTVILSIFFLNSCTSSLAERPNEPSERSKRSITERILSYHTQASPLKSLTISRTELKTIPRLHGFIWAPFILPLQNLTITNASLYLGYIKDQNPHSIQNAKDLFIPPPEEGGCEYFPYTETQSSEILPSILESTALKQKKLFTFINLTKQKQINTPLFFILDDQTHVPIAVARLNSIGKSQCLLPDQPYTVSMSYGLERSRREIHIDPKSQTINLEFPSVATLRIKPSLKNRIQIGDIIRIGKKFNLETVSEDSSQFTDFHIAAKITPDLYTNADMISHDFGLDEYLKTSFLIGKDKYQIELESGNYVVAVLRKNKLLCLNTISLQLDTSHELACDDSAIKQSEEELRSQFISEDTIFDVGFRPQGLMTNNSFVHWIVDTPGTVLLAPKLTSYTTTPIKNEFFSLVFKDKSGVGVSYTNYAASLNECVNTFKLPLIGMSKEHLIAGQVPFAEYVRATSRKYSTPYFLNQTNVTHTNGAEILILEPLLTNRGKLYGTENQTFMIRLIAPQWNSTQILEMYVNGRLFKRWLFSRGNLAERFSTTVTTNINETKNYVVKFVARGESQLSNFLTGRNSFFPFAETREFCVSIDGKDKCK